MADSLGGSAKTLMIVNVAPCSKDADYTFISLGWGSRAKTVTNDSKRNVNSKEEAKLKKELVISES